MSKRKHEDESDSDSDVEGHEDTRNTPVNIAFTIDEDGDLKMELDGGSVVVSRKALSLSSPVFRAMLGKNSKFRESTEKTVDDNGIQTISFPDDKFQAMVTVARIIHLQSDLVPKEVFFQHLYQIAILCDKYDLKRCLGPWIDIWAKPYLDSYAAEGFEGWLFMSKVFQYGGLFKDMTRHLILHSELSVTGKHVIGKCHDIGEQTSTPIMNEIAKAREAAMFLILDLYWQELCKLRVSNTTRVCTVGGTNGTKCDAINLGGMYQRFPDLQDPRNNKKSCRNSVMCMAKAPAAIPDVCGALIRKFGEHQLCAVGLRLTNKAAALAQAVHGLELNA